MKIRTALAVAAIPLGVIYYSAISCWLAIKPRAGTYRL
jgi:hypothetical protein